MPSHASAPSTTDRWLPFAVSAIVTGIFFIDVCNWWFACGCRSLWAGAAAACNVHAATAPHCPFCTRGIPGYAFVFVVVCAPQMAFAFGTRWSRTLRTLGCLALFPTAMIALAMVMGWYDGYWRHVV